MRPRTFGTQCHDSISAPTWTTDALTISYRRECQFDKTYRRRIISECLMLVSGGIQVDVAFCLPLPGICVRVRATFNP